MYDHEHHHDDCDCDAHEHDHIHKIESAVVPGAVEVFTSTHDDAVIVSGATIVLCRDAGRVKSALSSGLEGVALAVEDADGIIGHIKATFQVTATEMLSVTEPGVAMDIRQNEEFECRIGAAAIVFGVEPDFIEKKLRAALEGAVNAAK